MAGSYGTECDRVRQELTIAESQLRDYQARLGGPFLHDAYLSELTDCATNSKPALPADTRAGQRLAAQHRRTGRKDQGTQGGTQH